MARIECAKIAASKMTFGALADVPTAWTTLLDPPDFSLPSQQSIAGFPVDPTDSGRRIVPGEWYILRPVLARNKHASTTGWIEARFITEGGVTALAQRWDVPAGESVQIAAQGLSLAKRVAAGSNGDRLQVRASASTLFDVTYQILERRAADHVGIVT